MFLVGLIFALFIAPFLLVIVRGAPYLPSRRKQAKTALEVLGLKKGQTLLELGCGDGTVLIQAAELGIKAVGYEINPVLWMIARMRTRKYGRLVSVRFGDFWLKPFPKDTDAIYVFLIDHFMPKLDEKIKTEIRKNGVRKIKLASYTFEIPGKKPKTERGGIHVYVYGA